MLASLAVLAAGLAYRYDYRVRARHLHGHPRALHLLLLPDHIRHHHHGPRPRPSLGRPPLLAPQQTLAETERIQILQTLERCGWNHSRTAEALGIGRTTLWRKLKEYGLERSPAS